MKIYEISSNAVREDFLTVVLRKDEFSNLLKEIETKKEIDIDLLDKYYLIKYFFMVYQFLKEFRDFISDNELLKPVKLDMTLNVKMFKAMNKDNDKEFQNYLEMYNIIQEGERYYIEQKVPINLWFYFQDTFLKEWKEKLYNANLIPHAGRCYRVHFLKEFIDDILQKAKMKNNYQIKDIEYPSDTILMYLFENQYLEYFTGRRLPRYIESIYLFLLENRQFKHIETFSINELIQNETIPYERKFF